MIRLIRIATFSIAFFALSTGATAQNVYRCGNSYSQSPCPGGVAVEARDSRTPAQQAQAAAAVQRERQAADALEKSRMKEEAAAARAAQPASPALAPEAAKKAVHKSTAKKRKEPAYFTAKASGDKPALKNKKGADAAPADAPR